MDDKYQQPKEVFYVPEGTKELTIRRGKAPESDDPMYFQHVDYTGNIYAPAVFAEQRKSYNPVNAQAILDTEEACITLITEDEVSNRGFTIKGVLKPYELLEQLSINKNKTFNRTDFSKILRYSRRFFKDQEVYNKLLKSVSSFSAQVSQEVSDGNDLKGNKTQIFIQKVQHELVLSFDILIPIYKHTDPVILPVELCVDIVNGTAAFWLECYTLDEARDNLLLKIYERQAERLIKKDISIIYK